MFQVRIRRELCKGCGLCVDVCPKTLLALDGSLNRRGVHPATLAGAPEACTGCGNCAAMCPDAAIEIDEVDEVGQPVPEKQAKE